jgi:hypothetical protein
MLKGADLAICAHGAINEYEGSGHNFAVFYLARLGKS